MKLTLTNIALVLSLTGMAHAATVNVESFVDIDFSTDPTLIGNQLDNTFTASVGIYSGPALSATSTALEIASNWDGAGMVPFATGGLSQGYNGYFSTGDLAYTDADGLAAQSVWIWVSDGNLLNLLLENTNTAVAFPADADFPNNLNLAVSNAERPNWTIQLGSFTDTGANATYGGSYVLNDAIPEPSVALVGGIFGLVGLLRRRRA